MIYLSAIRKAAIGLIVVSASVSSSYAHDPKAPLNSEQITFMRQYELAREALVRSDLSSARQATAVVAALTVLHHESSGVIAPPGFVQDARKMINAANIEEFRTLFQSYSKRAANVAKLKQKYYIVHCANSLDIDHDWVQSDSKIGNPFTGKSADDSCS